MAWEAEVIADNIKDRCISQMESLRLDTESVFPRDPGMEKSFERANEMLDECMKIVRNECNRYL